MIGLTEVKIFAAKDIFIFLSSYLGIFVAEWKKFYVKYTTNNSCLSRNKVFCSISRHARKLTTPVRSAGPTGQASIWLIFRGLIFEHNEEIGQNNYLWKGTAQMEVY
jgi:hypothetical protein